MDSGEFVTFADEHRLTGYLTPNSDGDTYAKELSTDLFFISTTLPSNPNEEMLWERFGDKGRGVCLELRIRPMHGADLRKIRYKSGEPTALKMINNQLSPLGLCYIPWGISRICAFYLLSGYNDEREIRLLVKRHLDGPDGTIRVAGASVWPIPLGGPGIMTRNPYAEIELIGVRAGLKRSRDAVQQALAGTIYSNVPVS